MAERCKVGTHAVVNDLEKSFAAGLGKYITKQKKLGSKGRAALQNVATKVRKCELGDFNGRREREPGGPRGAHRSHPPAARGVPCVGGEAAANIPFSLELHIDSLK